MSGPDRRRAGEPVTAPTVPVPGGETILYLWAAEEEGTGHGACGVTDKPHTAQLRLLDALDTMPSGGTGTIRRARLDTNARPYPAYEYGPVQVRARRHHTTGEISLRGQVR